MSTLGATLNSTWIWTALACNLVGTVLFFAPAALERTWTRIFACTLCLIGIWIEKGMGLIVPGFIPSTLHEVIEYNPSLTEWKVTAGIWVAGLMLLTVFLKVAVAVFTDKMHFDPAGSPLPADAHHAGE